MAHIKGSFSPGSSSKRKRSALSSHPSSTSTRTNTSTEKSSSITGVDTSLPIFQYQSTLVTSVSNNPVTIVCGETGSGKSTQLPQFLAAHFTDGCVVCTQPRRVAAITIAQRVAKERHVVVGQDVGYSIRFDDSSCASTKIKYATDGVLLREIMTDTELSKYSVVILDEAHERSLQTDILIGLLNQLLKRRPSLRIVVMSATLEVNLFASYFNVDVEKVIHIKGRQFPVQIMYTPSPEPDFIEACLLTCLQIHEGDLSSSSLGGVLVFLSGQEDIENLQILLEEHMFAMYKEKHGHTHKPPLKSIKKDKPNGTSVRTQSAQNGKNTGPNGVNVEFEEEPADVDYIILPLYASMNPDDQLKAFQPSYPGKRKIILATNIAETSVTIPGIQYVVDPGKMKSRCMHPFTGADMLQVCQYAIHMEYGICLY